MISNESFKNVIKNTPLVSIDICLICAGKILLGLRTREPLKGFWFTPGGRIFKNETWFDCLKRVAFSELGLEFTDFRSFQLMGIWDHFYHNSAICDTISTHYVNLPHYRFVEHFLEPRLDDQHKKAAWFDLREVASSDCFHNHMNEYAKHLLKMDFKND